MRVLILVAYVGLAAVGVAFGVYSQQVARATEARLDVLAGGPVDVGFAQFMSLHHDQAILMAQLLLDDRPSRLKPLARSIANAQLFELGQMRGWLQLWDRPTYPPSLSMDWMLMGARPPDAQLQQYLLECQRAPTGMKGLATTEELNELRRLDGDARDRRFLELMIAHHEGGLPMARFAAGNARIPALRQLAARIVQAQAEEIAGMRMTLEALRESAAKRSPGAATLASPTRIQ